MAGIQRFASALAKGSLALLLVLSLVACQSGPNLGPPAGGTESPPVGSAAAWAPAVTGAKEDLSGIAYGHQTYVVTGAHGTLLTSTDGQKWTARSFTTKQGGHPDLTGIAFGNGTFELLTAGGAVYRSPDGVAWQEAVPEGPDAFGSLVFGHDRFAAIGPVGVVTSVDGTKWVAAPGATGRQVRDLVVTPKGFAALGDAGILLESVDGKTWSSRPIDLCQSGCTGQALLSTSLAVGSGQYVVTSASGRGTGPLFTSADGVTWTAQPDVSEFGLDRVLFGGGLFAAVDFLKRNRLYTSTDAQKWVRQDLDEGHEILNMAAVNGRVVAVGRQGRIMIYGTK